MTEPPISREASDSAPLHVPIHVRNVALVVIAIIGALFALRWAQDVVVPVLFGVMLSYALTPAVTLMERQRLPRALGAGLLLSAIALATGWGAWSLSDQASAFVDTLPQVTLRLRQIVEGRDGSVSTIAKVQAVATEIQAVADGVAASSPAPGPSAVGENAPAQPTSRKGALPAKAPAAGGTAHVVVEKPRFDIRSYVLTGTLGVLKALSQTAIVFLVALFMLSSGNAFRRKMVKFAGPTLSQKKVTVETLNEISQQIQRYLQVQLAVSILVGICTGVAFLLLGVDQPAVWGVVAAVMNLVPYVGAVLVAGAASMMGLVQFGSLEMALVVAGVSLIIHALIGNILTPWWLGRASRMSSLAIFVAVLAFGWLWGVAGLLMGVPILMVVKSICDHVDELKPIGELLSDESDPRNSPDEDTDARAAAKPGASKTPVAVD
ncbi:MAG TPA: AI-2E family transporter [Burkholderiaceae bacterium]|nr:AI-2E family transporter [Burkholderiaceae bacterium]